MKANPGPSKYVKFKLLTPPKKWKSTVGDDSPYWDPKKIKPQPAKNNKKKSI